MEELQQRRIEVASERSPQFRLGLENRTELSSAQRDAFDNGNRLDAVLTVSQLLYDFGASGHRVASSDLEIEAHRWQYRAVLGQLLFDLIEAYYEVARYQAIEDLAQKNVDEHLTLVNQLASRLEAGAGSKADLLLARSQWVGAKSLLVFIRGQRREAEELYLEFYQAKPDKLVRPFPSFLKYVTELAENELIYRNPSYQALKRETDAAAREALAVSRDALPKVSLQVQGRRFDVNESARAENDLALLVSVNYPLYSGGAQSARAKQAAAREAQSHHQQQVALREIVRLGQSARNDILTRQEEMKLAAINLEANREVLEAYRSQFQIGRRSLGDILDAQSNVFESGRGYVNSVFDHDLAHYRFLLIHGQLKQFFDRQYSPNGADDKDIHGS